MKFIDNLIDRYFPLTERSQMKEFVLVESPRVNYRTEPPSLLKQLHVESYKTYATLKVFDRSITVFGKYCSNKQDADKDFDARTTPIQRLKLAWKIRTSASKYHGPMVLAEMKNGRPVPPKNKSRDGLKKATRMFIRLRRKHA